MNFHGHPSWDSCILITSKNLDNQRFGTGFLVHHSEQKSYIVTCAHVISDVGGTDLIEADGKSAAVVNIGADDGLDLAVIEIDKLLSKPIIKLKVLGIAGSSFLTVGFRAFGRHFSIAPLFGTVAAAVALESKKYSNRVKAWNLKIRDGEHLHDGYSGSPVIDADGFCLGVVTYKQGDGQVGLAISIEELEKIWDTIPTGLIEKASEPESYCDRLVSQATRFCIAGDLAQALDIYQQVITIEPSYPRINMMIRSVEAEIERPYVDRYGRVQEDAVFTYPQDGDFAYPHTGMSLPATMISKSVRTKRRPPVLVEIILIGILTGIMTALGIWLHLPILAVILIDIFIAVVMTWLRRS
jgi:hypothetical protein